MLKWSEVYSCDAFETRFKKNVMDADAGMDYRMCILAPGGSKDGIDMLKDFIGRAPSQDAFLRSRGLHV